MSALALNLTTTMARHALLAALLLLVSPPVVSATYYVDSGAGDDADGGLSPDAAFRTLAEGVAALDKRGGDTLVLRGSFREALDLNYLNASADRDPDPDRVTTVRSAEGARAVIDGGIPVPEGSPFDWQGTQPNPPETTDGVHLYRGIVIANSNHITIDGLEVRGIAGVGVLTWRANHVTVRNNIVAHSGQGDIRAWNRPPVEEFRFGETNIVTHNLLFGSTWADWQGDRAVLEDPLFVRAPKTLDAEADFTLRASSPAIDAGVDTGLPTSDNSPRDPGAFEYGLEPWQAGVIKP